MILFVLCEIGFVSRVSNREQAFQADGVKKPSRFRLVEKKVEV
jgi:hypothetical protein